MALLARILMDAHGLLWQSYNPSLSFFPVIKPDLSCPVLLEGNYPFEICACAGTVHEL